MNVRYHDQGTITDAGRRVIDREAVILDRRLADIENDLRVLDVTVDEHLRDGSFTAKLNLHVLGQSITVTGNGPRDDSALRIAFGRLDDGLGRFLAKLRGEPSQRREGKFHRDKAEVVREVVDAAQNWPPEGPATDLEAVEWGRVETIERKG